MSETIRKYKPDEKWFKEAEELTLTAVVGGEEHNHSIQFTIGGRFIVLTQAQLLDLISTIANRINCRKGFTATGTTTDLKTIAPDGTMRVENEDV